MIPACQVAAAFSPFTTDRARHYWLLFATAFLPQPQRTEGNQPPFSRIGLTRQDHYSPPGLVGEARLDLDLLAEKLQSQRNGVYVWMPSMLWDSPEQVSTSRIPWGLGAGVGMGEAPADEGGDPAEQQNP